MTSLRDLTQESFIQLPFTPDTRVWLLFHRHEETQIVAWPRALICTSGPDAVILAVVRMSPPVEGLLKRPPRYKAVDTRHTHSVHPLVSAPGSSRNLSHIWIFSNDFRRCWKRGYNLDVRSSFFHTRVDLKCAAGIENQKLITDFVMAWLLLWAIYVKQIVPAMNHFHTIRRQADANVAS